MPAGRSRLDRFLRRHANVGASRLRPLLAQGRVLIDGQPADGINQLVDQFTRVQLDDRVIQDRTPRYLMLHKPAGVLSATRDRRHPTVIDLLDGSEPATLHIAGRLDYLSSGLLLLTNDGRWSRRLSLPGSSIPKRYRVTLDRAANADCVRAFSDGIYFSYEGITTRPATLEIISERRVDVTLVEGRYRQIRRMFGRFGIRVLALHRYAVGNLRLDPGLAPGEYRELTEGEISGIFTRAGIAGLSR